MWILRDKRRADLEGWSLKLESGDGLAVDLVRLREIVTMDLQKILKWAMPILGLIWGQVSQPLKAAIRAGVDEWAVKAGETPNVFDDILVNAVKWALSVLEK